MARMARKTYKRKNVYGQWAGNERGRREDSACCIENIMRGMLFFQCSRKRGHGPDKLFCKQHAKQYAPDAKEETR